MYPWCLCKGTRKVRCLIKGFWRIPVKPFLDAICSGDLRITLDEDYTAPLWARAFIRRLRSRPAHLTFSFSQWRPELFVKAGLFPGSLFIFFHIGSQRS